MRIKDYKVNKKVQATQQHGWCFQHCDQMNYEQFQFAMVNYLNDTNGFLTSVNL